MHSANIDPIETRYYGSDKLIPSGGIDISGTGWYTGKAPNPKLLKKYTNYYMENDQFPIYPDPVQPIIYKSKQSKDKSSQWKPLTPEIAKGHFSGDISNIVYRETGDPNHPYDITGIPAKPKPKPTLKKKVSSATPISMTNSFTPGVTSIQHPEIKLQNLPQGEYRTSYWDPEIKDWNERAFMSQQESDQFANEMSQRGYGAPYGNVTQTRKINKKSTGGWLEKYN
jgi:hypothetical protein